MSQDVRQWLAEIKTLQQKLATAHQERDEAYASATSWRNLYETEAKQRRTEANLSRQAIEALTAELEDLRNLSQLEAETPEKRREIQTEIARLHNVKEIQQRLVEALLECERLKAALRAEQTAHTQTRHSLTAALGDTVDMLTKERGVRSQTEDPLPNGSRAASASPIDQPPISSKTPSLELPQFD